MSQERRCLVGHDSDAFAAITMFTITAITVIIVITIIIILIVYVGAFIGGFYALKNYFLSFKHNVYDSNRDSVKVE